ncbi:MAG: hypothetical protein JWQ89_3766 [Devosia sp.]|nr:hypothetical protein [Devosia sp.]
MTYPATPAPSHRRHAPCELVPATPPVANDVSLFEFLQFKAGRK